MAKKRCRLCRHYKEVEEHFYKDASSRDGRQPKCITCARKLKKNYTARKAEEKKSMETPQTTQKIDSPFKLEGRKVTDAELQAANRFEIPSDAKIAQQQQTLSDVCTELTKDREAPRHHRVYGVPLPDGVEVGMNPLQVKAVMEAKRQVAQAVQEGMAQMLGQTIDPAAVQTTLTKVLNDLKERKVVLPPIAPTITVQQNPQEPTRFDFTFTPPGVYVQQLVKDQQQPKVLANPHNPFDEQGRVETVGPSTYPKVEAPKKKGFFDKAVVCGLTKGVDDPWDAYPAIVPAQATVDAIRAPGDEAAIGQLDALAAETVAIHEAEKKASALMDEAVGRDQKPKVPARQGYVKNLRSFDYQPLSGPKIFGKPKK